MPAIGSNPNSTLTGPSANQAPAPQPAPAPPTTAAAAPNNMGACDPFNNPEVYDRIIFGGVTSPGRCLVGEFVREYKFDTKEGKGTAGATSTLTNVPPAKGKITFWVWTAAQFVAWDAFVALLKQYPTKGAVNAAAIYYPTLADIDVAQVTTTKISNWVPVNPGAPDGYWTRWVEFMEYAPPPPISITSTPTTAVENAEKVAAGAEGGGSQPDPNAQDQAEVQGLLGQLQQPAGSAGPGGA